MKKILISALALASFACSSSPENEFIGTWVTKLEPTVQHIINGKGERVKSFTIPPKKAYDTLQIIKDNGTILINGSVFKFNKDLNILEDTRFFGLPDIRINEQKQLISRNLKYSKIE